MSADYTPRKRVCLHSCTCFLTVCCSRELGYITTSLHHVPAGLMAKADLNRVTHNEALPLPLPQPTGWVKATQPHSRWFGCMLMTSPRAANSIVLCPCGTVGGLSPLTLLYESKAGSDGDNTIQGQLLSGNAFQCSGVQGSLDSDSI